MVTPQLRVPEEWVKALIPRVAQDQAMRATGQITLSLVLRLAIRKGLDALKQQYPAAPEAPGHGGSR